jgi:hypothetical protein
LVRAEEALGAERRPSSYKLKSTTEGNDHLVGLTALEGSEFG